MLRKSLLSIIKALKTWKERGDEINELRKMSDHELSDIGLSRVDAERIIRMGKSYADGSLRER